MIRSFAAALAVLLLSNGVFGGDWPQILGPNRDGIATGEQLLSSWPASGPRETWKTDVGQGFAGVAVRNNLLVLFHRLGYQEIVEARNAITGAEIWRSEFACRYQSGMSSDAGPRCVPTISQKHVFVYGVNGVLRCLDLRSGDELWHVDTWQQFSAPEGYFGAGSSPVLIQDRLIVNVGGRDNAAVVAFSVNDGSTIWQSFNDTASYSSPIVAKLDGQQHVIVVTRMNTLSFDPADGRVRFQFPFGMRGPTVNGATPVVVDNHLFVSASYRVGSVWAKIEKDGSQPVPSGEDLLATQYATPVRHNGLLFAVDGRQDIGSATLKCIDPASQRVLWQEGGFDYGSLIRVNDEMLFLTFGGDLMRFKASATQFQQGQVSNVLDNTPRGYRLPALSNGRLFLRDDKTLKCLLVGESDVQ
ncbi:MAG: PQQ-binding-like beta-propeller repeat protein [Fuerstiella sp.]|nr:PQQ-binding-like beta-propeller repeat protein [Fuerstiella sp.]MCP4859597.1 PQQ-binding-like beta-propeller repeat protein [Fuerstiella sp.]